eukprot:CAMPEP_0184648960 /NCGR_PEP_ID=MMETSP0308-20130426/6229_1 /TAXON_ID=38269 /ORGANISM="Gloeochaete witrockiana, Strain SAG 46.84" /LENGTH=380 /DNA_ID=CAMNT_0027081307 /DNA_START=69 /DNA_END=1211 /DNA_ORIENTATION=-
MSAFSSALRRLCFGLICVPLAAILAFFVITPSPVDPIKREFAPCSTPLGGALKPNQLLATQSRVFGEDVLIGPEGQACDANGRSAVAGSIDGKIFKVFAENSTVALVFETGGRPLGVAVDREGIIWACVVAKGLVRIDLAANTLEVVIPLGNHSLQYPNDLAISSDGIIYFTDCSQHRPQLIDGRWGTMLGYKYEWFEGKKTGRLLSYNIASGEVQTLYTGFSYANGVALSSKEDYVVIGETCLRRVWRYWLKGPKIGTAEVLLSDIPGYIDNVRLAMPAKGDRFWLGIHGLPSSLEFLFDYPFIIKQIAKLPPRFHPHMNPYGLAIEMTVIDEGAQITDSLHDPSGKVIPTVATVCECDGVLYIGTLTGKGIHVIDRRP